MFITFEGIEGCGKTSQIRLLSDELQRRGLACTATREPGGTKIGEAIRGVFLHCSHDDMLPMTELLLVTAARAQHAAQVIRPRLEDGAIVLCDRFIDATAAYQGFAAGLGVDTVMRSHALFVGGLMPDFTILFDCPAELGLLRSRERNRNEGIHEEEGRFEERDLQDHERVRAGYLEQARRDPGRIVVLDATADPDAVHRNVLSAVLHRLNGAGYAI